VADGTSFTDVFRVPGFFPNCGDAPMTFLLIAGVVLLALWLVETVVFLVGYGQQKSNS